MANRFESVRSAIGTLPASIPPTSAFVQSDLPSRARMLACRAAGVIGPIASTRAVPTSTGWAIGRTWR